MVAAPAVQGRRRGAGPDLGLRFSAPPSRPRRGTAIGLFSAVTGISVALGPLVGGAIVEGIAWEWIFWLNVPIGLAAIPLVFTRIEESFGGDTGLDIPPGLGLISAAALGIVWGLVRGNAAAGAASRSSAHSRPVCSWWERSSPANCGRQPMLPMRFFRSRAFSAGNAAIFLTFAALFGAVFFFAQMLQTALGYGPSTPASGCSLGRSRSSRLPQSSARWLTGSASVGSWSAGSPCRGSRWAGSRPDRGPGLTYSEFMLPSVVAGVGVSMAIPAAQNSVVGSFALEDVGKAAGANSMMRELGGVFGIATAAAVFAGTGSFSSADAFLDGFAPAVAVIAAFSLAGAVVALALPGRRQPAKPRFSAPLQRSRAIARLS